MRLIHIVAGLLALLAGAIALAAAKGSGLHRRSGRVFVGAMLAMTTTAAVIAAFLRPNVVNATAALLTLYLVCTALLTVRPDLRHARALLVGLMGVALVAGLLGCTLGLDALGSASGNVDGIPAPPLLMFGTVGLAGLVLDARLLWAGGIQGPHRLARHLWRMTFAMWIATSSFFLGQAKVFPEPLRNFALLSIPVLVVTVLLCYWLAKVLLPLRRRGAATPARFGARVAAAQDRELAP